MTAGAAQLRSSSALVFMVLATILALAAVQPDGAFGARFSGHVSGAATGLGHSFVVGHGLYLVFVDKNRAYNPYRVCWTRGHGTHCWRRTTGKRRHKSKVLVAAPENV